MATPVKNPCCRFKLSSGVQAIAFFEMVCSFIFICFQAYYISYLNSYFNKLPFWTQILVEKKFDELKNISYFYIFCALAHILFYVILFLGVIKRNRLYCKICLIIACILWVLGLICSVLYLISEIGKKKKVDADPKKKDETDTCDSCGIAAGVIWLLLMLLRSYFNVCIWYFYQELKLNPTHPMIGNAMVVGKSQQQSFYQPAYPVAQLESGAVQEKETTEKEKRKKKTKKEKE